MNDTEHQKMKRALKDAVRYAIERMGMERFRQCSFFMSSWRSGDKG